MMTYKVVYKLFIGTQEIDLSTFVECNSDTHIDDVIEQASIILNGNIHIPVDMLNAADITVIPAPGR